LKALALAIVVLVGGLLISATVDFPDWGDPASPAALHVSPRYIEKSMEETSVPNVVTSVLADYRGFDTMFETTVVFTAGVACFLLLRRREPRPEPTRVYRHQATGVIVEMSQPPESEPAPEVFQRIDDDWTPHDLIVMNVCRLLIPFIQLCGLYVIAHGHHSPGGGFQGGVILGASVILIALSWDLRTAEMRLREVTTGLMSAIGVFIYAGVGALALALGGNFLDYAALAPLLRVDPVAARSLGIFFVEVGVGLAVMATMVFIYKNLASEGRLDQGL
jgi:multicomponent Na+:H+ antiporter subunit B